MEPSPQRKMQLRIVSDSSSDEDEVAPKMHNSVRAAHEEWENAVEDPNAFDPNAFYTKIPSRSETCAGPRFQIEVNLMTQINEIVSDRVNFPEYTTPQDFMRDALVHALHRARRSDRRTSPLLTRILLVTESRQKVHDTNRHMDLCKATAEELTQTLERLDQAGEDRAKRALVRSISHRLNGFDESVRPGLIEVLIAHGYDPGIVEVPDYELEDEDYRDIPPPNYTD